TEQALSDCVWRVLPGMDQHTYGREECTSRLYTGGPQPRRVTAARAAEGDIPRSPAIYHHGRPYQCLDCIHHACSGRDGGCASWTRAAHSRIVSGLSNRSHAGRNRHARHSWIVVGSVVHGGSTMAVPMVWGGKGVARFPTQPSMTVAPICDKASTWGF